MLWEETHTLTHTHKRSKVEGVKGEGRADTDRHRQVGAGAAGRMLGQRAWLHALSSGGSRRGRSRHSD